MKLKNKSRIIVFIFSLIVWIALADIKSYEEVLVGLVLAVLISLLAGHFLVTTKNRSTRLDEYYISLSTYSSFSGR